MNLTTEEQKIVSDFRTLFYNLGPAARGGTTGTWARTYWFGARILKNPFDLWIYQELIGETRPDLIIECGSGAGGSALYFASLCSLIGKGEVLSVDIHETHYKVDHPRAQFLLGSSVAPEIIAQVHERAANKAAMVILDSDHSFAHVTAELETYSGLVGPGNYLVVEDTNLPETKRATLTFIEQHPEFEIDLEQEKYLMTFNTFLKRKTAP